MTLMAHLIKPKTQYFLKWVSSNLTENSFRPSKSSLWTSGFFHNAQNPRFYGTKAARDRKKVEEIARRVRREAQTALLAYLHSTRSFQYLDAEHISRNSPRFLDKLLEEVENEKDVERSLTRFLRYHPINEFEPFFESMGFSPSEYSSYLPRDLIFLSDDQVLLSNYQVLCKHDISRSKIGKIYKEANEAFRYDHGVLDLRILSFREVGFDQTSVSKVVASCPHLLVGDTVQDFFKVLERLKSLGISLEWIVEHLSEEGSYSWHHMLELLCLFSKLGCSDEQLGGLLYKHPEILWEDAGSTTIQLIGFLLKFGASADDIISMFLQLPQIRFRKYVSNLRQCYLFFVEIEMEFQDIAKLVCAYPMLLGSCSLKKANSLLRCLNTGKRRLCEIIKENPQELKNWIHGSGVKQLPSSAEEDIVQKTKFLLEWGFVENSNEMKKALRVFRGRRWKLQERLDCLVNAGLNRKDVKKMFLSNPKIINQRKEVIEMKIDYLQNLGYPVSSLIAFPSFLAKSIWWIKLRVSMYNWLKDQGTVRDNLRLRSIIMSSDRQFITKKVNSHPNGPEVWEKLKKQIYTE